MDSNINERFPPLVIPNRDARTSFEYVLYSFAVLIEKIDVFQRWILEPSHGTLNLRLPPIGTDIKRPFLQTLQVQEMSSKFWNEI